MKPYSLEHEEFLKRRIKEKRFIILSQFFIIFFFVIIWEFLAQQNLINTFLFSSPMRMIHTFYQLIIENQFFSHLFTTLYEVFLSFLLSVSFGIVVAIILWSSPFLSKVLDPYLTIINSLPKVALGPLIIIWFGTSIHSIVFMSLLISLFVTIINIYQGFISVPNNYLTMVRSFGASKWQEFRYVVFPFNRGTILSTLKVNVSMNLIGVIMGELLVSKKGIGYLIMYGSQIFHLDLVMTCVFILAIVSYLLYCFIQKIK